MATVTLPDELAKRVEPFSRWLPTVLETSLLALKTPAVETASELVEFLASNPLAGEVHAYHVSERAQARMSRLLALNQAGVLGEAEARELDELIKLEHLIITLKASLTPEDIAAA
ncbi:MAG: hypothetical protein M3498_12525 [Deinococcota bacterium]|jgi:hypothetical protein|nr:hypothetical protein [Deinococcota bacterium]